MCVSVRARAHARASKVSVERGTGCACHRPPSLSTQVAGARSGGEPHAPTPLHPAHAYICERTAHPGPGPRPYPTLSGRLLTYFEYAHCANGGNIGDIGALSDNTGA